MTGIDRSGTAMTPDTRMPSSAQPAGADAGARAAATQRDDDEGDEQDRPDEPEAAQHEEEQARRPVAAEPDAEAGGLQEDLPRPLVREPAGEVAERRRLALRRADRQLVERGQLGDPAGEHRGAEHDRPGAAPRIRGERSWRTSSTAAPAAVDDHEAEQRGARGVGDELDRRRARARPRRRLACAGRARPEQAHAEVAGRRDQVQPEHGRLVEGARTAARGSRRSSRACSAAARAARPARRPSARRRARAPPRARCRAGGCRRGTGAPTAARRARRGSGSRAARCCRATARAPTCCRPGCRPRAPGRRRACRRRSAGRRW